MCAHGKDDAVKAAKASRRAVREGVIHAVGEKLPDLCAGVQPDIVLAERLEHIPATLGGDARRDDVHHCRSDTP